MKKEMEKYWEKILRDKYKKKNSPQYEIGLWKTFEVNNEHKLNVDDQQDDKNKNLHRQWRKSSGITAAITPMKKKNHLGVTWIKKVFYPKYVEKTYLGRVHWALVKWFWQIFRNKKEVYNHMNEAWE